MWDAVAAKGDRGVDLVASLLMQIYGIMLHFYFLQVFLFRFSVGIFIEFINSGYFIYKIKTSSKVSCVLVTTR